MFENPRRGRQARNFTKNVPKILDLKSSSEHIFFRKLSLGAPVWIRMGMPLLCSYKSTENGAILEGLCWCDYAQFTSGSIKTYVTRSVQISDWKMSLWNCLIQRIDLILRKLFIILCCAIIWLADLGGHIVVPQIMKRPPAVGQGHPTSIFG